MREIEFRLWDIASERMFYQRNEWNFDNEYDTLNFPLNIDGFMSFKTSDTTVLMQYTGLKDINDTKIFEGDLVKCFYPERNGITHTLLGPVSFIDGSYFITETERSYSSLLYSEFASIEVIGNIYQHKHLLEEE